jgi:hypothetical protein
LEKYLSLKWHKGDPYDHCGVYGLLYQDCGGALVGQPERKFRTRSEEIVTDIRIKLKKRKTGYSHHILSAGHACGKLEGTLEIDYEERARI